MHFHASTTISNPEEPKRSKRERFRAKAEEFLHIKHHQGDGALPVSQPEKYSTNDAEDLVKKAQELLNKKNGGQNDNSDPKKDLGAALGAMGPVAYAMWKKKKENKKRRGRQGRSENNNNDDDNVDWEEVEEEVEEEEEEEEEEEGSSGFGEFLSWIQEAFTE